MMKKKCLICKAVCALLVLGALNWGLVGVFDINLVERAFGAMSNVTRVVYGLIGLAGVMALLSCFKDCPGCKK